MTEEDNLFVASNGVVIQTSGYILLSDDFEPLWPSAQIALEEYFRQKAFE